MKIADVILIIFLALVSISSLFYIQRLQELSAEENGVAIVLYQNEVILEIALGSNAFSIKNPNHVLEVNADSGIFKVTGTLGPVTIFRENGFVSVIEQTSPQNICELQGATNSRLKPLTCLPNEVIIRIEKASSDLDDDAILS